MAHLPNDDTVTVAKVYGISSGAVIDILLRLVFFPVAITQFEKQKTCFC
jgi:hypothetical protein